MTLTNYLNQFAGTDELDYIIEDAKIELAKYFPDYPVVLKPEYRHGMLKYWMLLVQIDWLADFSTHWETLEDFRQEWWLDNIERAHGDLGIDIDWVVPSDA